MQVKREARTWAGLVAATVMVRKLAGGRTTRTVGPAGSTDLDLDDSGTNLAYVDPTRHVRLVDLGWAVAPGRTIVDHAAPPVPSLYWPGQRSIWPSPAPRRRASRRGPGMERATTRPGRRRCAASSTARRRD
ncbi:hypothetical protein GCM10025864_19610 [Luteimicrobium album]|uniref:Uncharacterized protein n=1 Tax=Luteimicrobium album TaxID=1054550 RepID=A0ABQ6I178_9MICO|nr:hypothetical protein [Luteimicrobium album]GMA24202.1 hypothetical protein GCM10025864_19610 [Luteimicrobium album]